MPSTPHITSLLQDIQTKGKSVTSNPRNEEARKALLEVTRMLVTKLEDPVDVIVRMNWREPTRWAAVRLGIDIHLFEALVANNGSPKSLEKLAGDTGCDPLLLCRILKHLSATDVIRESGINEYAPNAVSTLLSTRGPQGITNNCFDLLNVVHGKLPEFFRKTGYKNPVDKDNTGFNNAFGTNLHYFEYINQPDHKEDLAAFEAHMFFLKTLGKKWFELVDVDEIFDNVEDGEKTLIVDIGGSFGYDMIDFNKLYPNMPGGLVLQDLSSTINSLPKDFPHDKISAQIHDFFTTQPVKGAKVYYLHMVLHDWPDTSCRDILKNVIPAMEKGYSKILLNEMVVADQGANWFDTSVDWMMMTTHASRERTETVWRELVESVGLKIRKFWGSQDNPEKIIELELI